MREIKYRRERFGYTIAFPDGTTGLYQDSAGELLNQGVGESSAYERHLLESFSISKDFHLTGPLFVWIELTHACNLSCKHCYIRAGEPREYEMTTAEVKMVLDQCVALGVFLVILTGGEPLLRPDLMEIIRYAHERNLILGLITNGTLLTADLIASFPRDNFSVSVSVDGMNYFRKIRGGYDFTHVAERIEMLQQAGIPCIVNSTIAKGNLDEIGRVVEWCDRREVPSSTTPFAALGRAQDYLGELQFGPEDVKKIKKIYKLEMMNILKLKPVLMNHNIKRFVDFAFNLVRITRRCKGGRHAAYIAANGDVYPCSNCASAEMYHVGNLLQTPLTRLWEESFREMRTITWEDYSGCRGCKMDIDYFCISRCPVLAQYYKGDPLQCAAQPIDMFLYETAIENIREISASIARIQAASKEG